MTTRSSLPRGGVIVPMITPLTPTGEVDTASTASLCRHLVSAGVSGLLVLGSTGENAALSHDQRRVAVRSVVDAVGGQVHVMAGVPSLGTPDAVRDAAEFADLGADSVLLPAPFGFELSPDELVGHFGVVASACPVPVVAYEVPGRVKVSLTPDLVVRLLEAGSIVGVKDSSGNLGVARALSEALKRRGLPVPHFTGSEECIDGFLLGGGTGCIPGLSNLFPEYHVALTRHATAGRWVAASAVQGQIVDLLRIYFHPLQGASFTGAFFAIVKETLRQLGVIDHNTTCAPFTQADAGIAEHVRSHLAQVAGRSPFEPSPDGVDATGPTVVGASASGGL